MTNPTNTSHKVIHNIINKVVGAWWARKQCILNTLFCYIVKLYNGLCLNDKANTLS